MSPERRRSLLSSLVSTAVDAGCFALASLALAGTALVAARWSAGALGAATSFGLNRCWVFRTRDASLWRQGARYVLTAFSAVTLATGLFWALARATSLDVRLLHLGSLGAVWLCFTFPVLRGWVFADAPA